MLMHNETIFGLRISTKVLVLSEKAKRAKILGKCIKKYGSFSWD